MDLIAYVSVLPPLFAAAVVVWALSLLLRDAGIADVAWGFGFLLVTALWAWPHRPLSPRGLLVIGLATVWAARLSGYIFLRNRGRGEDPRYGAMRKTWGQRFRWVSLFTVFLLQATLLWIAAAPLHHAVTVTPPVPLGFVAVAGVALWAIGMYFEAVGDWQLARFKANPDNRGKVLESGLWRYTRHPNYFGEFLIWWGFFLIAAETVTGLWTLVSPLLMSFLLLRVSGVPMLDDLMRRTKPDYRHYIERTNGFFPWFPK